MIAVGSAHAQKLVMAIRHHRGRVDETLRAIITTLSGDAEYRPGGEKPRLAESAPVACAMPLVADFAVECALQLLVTPADRRVVYRRAVACPAAFVPDVLRQPKR